MVIPFPNRKPKLTFKREHDRRTFILSEIVEQLVAKLSFPAQKTALPSPQLGNEGEDVSFNIPLIQGSDPFIPRLFERRTHLLDAFEQIAVQFGQAKTDVHEMFHLLPQALKGAPVAWSRIDQDWCYYFGEPYTGLPKSTVVVGSPQMPKVKLLYRTLSAVRHHLPLEDQQQVFLQLGNREKHAEFLEEFAPVLRLNGAPANVRYEVPGEGNSSIDFLIEKAGCQPILLEVKNRLKDLIHHLSHLAENEAVGKSEEDIPAPDPAWLFKSVLHKFSPALFEARAQGVWIRSNIAVPQTSLNDYFDAIDPERLHFAVLSAGEDRAYILARSPAIGEFVQSFFKLVHHPHCVR